MSLDDSDLILNVMNHEISNLLAKHTVERMRNKDCKFIFKSVNMIHADDRKKLSEFLFSTILFDNKNNVCYFYDDGLNILLSEHDKSIARKSPLIIDYNTGINFALNYLIRFKHINKFLIKHVYKTIRDLGIDWVYFNYDINVDLLDSDEEMNDIILKYIKNITLCKDFFYW